MRAAVVSTIAAVLVAGLTVVAAIRIGPVHEVPFQLTIRFGVIAVVALVLAGPGAILLRRQRARADARSARHADTAFIAARATRWTSRELAEWSPGLRVHLPAELAFDKAGLFVWNTTQDERTQRIAAREELAGLEVFQARSWTARSTRWGILVRLHPRAARAGAVHLWIGGDPLEQDEYAMRRVVTRIERVLAASSS